MAMITKIFILTLALIPALCRTSAKRNDVHPFWQDRGFMEHMLDEKPLGEINRDGVKCTFKEGGGKSDQWMGQLDPDQCLDACLELRKTESQINGISVLTKRNKKGCYCLQKFSKRNNNKNYKNCILQGEGFEEVTGGEGQMTDVIKSGGVTCEFKPGGGKNAQWIGHFKQDECLKKCLEEQAKNSHINGMEVFQDQTKKGCSCLQNMPDRNNNKRLKSCVLQGEGTQGMKVKEIKSQGFQCKFENGGGRFPIRVKEGGLRQDQCIVKCLEMKKSNAEINGVQVFKNQKKAGCWCLKGMPNRNENKNHKSCVLESKRKDSLDIDPYRNEVYDTYDMRDTYDLNKRNNMRDTYESYDNYMRDMYDMEERNKMQDKYDTYDLSDMYEMKKRKNMRDRYDGYDMRDTYDMKQKRNDIHDTYDTYGL